MESSISIVGAYSDRCILLTGVTGFLGKVLLERLLWEFPDVAEIRLLMRVGKYDSVEARFEKEILSSPIFTRLQQRHGGPQALSAFSIAKVRLFAGDISQDRLGLDIGSYEALAAGLDLVLHSAALVSWDERLDNSIRNNTLGARRMLQLTRHAGSAKLVHISTCWVHGQRRGICAEEVPQVSMDIDEEVRAAIAFGVQADSESRQPEVHQQFEREARLRQSESKSANLEEELRVRWAHKRVADWGVARAKVNGWWDNYTYSKALAETLLARERGDVPVAVVRPSGITGSMRDPERGWTDAYLLTEPLIEGVGKKNITEFPGNPGCVIDTVPVDLVVNVILVAGGSLLCSASQKRSVDDKMPVYQVASGDTNPLTLGEIEKIWRDHFAERPFLQPGSGKPITGLKPISYWGDVESFSRALRQRYVMPLQFVQKGLELLPGWENVGLLRRGRGAVVRQWRTVEKVLHLANLYSSYTLNEWHFETSKTRQMMEGLSHDDMQRFPFNPGNIEWPEYWKDVHIPGMRRYVLKEPGFQAIETHITSRL